MVKANKVPDHLGLGEDVGQGRFDEVIEVVEREAHHGLDRRHILQPIEAPDAVGVRVSAHDLAETGVGVPQAGDDECWESGVEPAVELDEGLAGIADR